MMSFKSGLLVIGLSVFSFNGISQTIQLSKLKKGTNQTVYVGATSGLVHASIDSVNNMADQQYRDNQGYSSSSSSSSASSSSSNTASSSGAARRSSSSSSASNSAGVKEIYNAGTKTKGYVNYRVKCKSGRATTVHKRSNGFWYNVGSNIGESYRHLSQQEFGKKYCQ